MAHIKVLIIFAIFRLSKDFLRVFVPVGSSVRVCDSDFNDGFTSTMVPEAIAAGVAALFRDWSWCGGLLVPLFLLLLLLWLLLSLLLHW